MQRTSYLREIDFQFKIHSVYGLLGPRQVGKTTLAHQYAQKFKNPYFIDLENPLDLAGKSRERRMLFLNNTKWGRT